MNSTTTRTLQNVMMALVVVGLLALALGGYLAPLSRLALSPFISAQTWLSTRFHAIQELVSSPKDMAGLRQRNTELEAENARLQTRIIELEKEITEVQVLYSLLDFATTHPEHDYLGAEVIAYDPNPFLQYVIINRGSDEGLRRGMPVVTHKGLVGRISAVGPNYAKVQLITDPGSHINAHLQFSNVDGVLSGQITGEVLLGMIPQEAELNVGDTILTSGLGGAYPANIMIGQVTGIAGQTSDLFQTATVQPLVDYSQLRIVLVIINFKPVDLTPLIPNP